MNDFWSYLCLGGVCLSPLFTFLLGLMIGRRFRIKLERLPDSGQYAVDDEI